MEKQLILEKIEQTKSILNELDIDMWMIFVRESATLHDPSLDLVVGANATWQSAFCITKDGDTTAIIGSLEEPNMKSVGTYSNIISYLKSVKEPLIEYLTKQDPKKIAINYSVNSNLADGLTHGMYISLMDILKDTPYKDRMISSENIIASLRGRKSAAEISLMKHATEATNALYDEVTGFIAPGRTEKEIAEFLKHRIKEKGYGLAWDEDHCPAVYTGPETAGAHSGPTDRKVERGHIINMDFGVKHHGYCSDMQRTWYILREGEKEAPEEVKKGFRVIREAIDKAFAAIKPGVAGWEVDAVAREHIAANGYEEFPHGLGHQVGRLAHDGGVGLFPRWERYGNVPNLKIEENQVFTIEPRLTVEGFGVVTVEDMVVVRVDGAEYLTTPQTELMVI